ncbi:pyridoxine 5'-phosphate oxidase [Legionella lansingensis]|uniref:Pyridoxine 5'-phosphate oxidase n=1 Tax=Legionella lansingensis TaxID=45067 RepID=A0A0W0VYC1_9GAMM|nr:pyridoxal 5'-phosphate synthase [Legionella lansingensis]KTD24985.1 pyridoxine 5'-phosphate oxidase [Legionella lansingensis]SNV48295.1 pyridoxine 5'-phosphate oxidase [Legionella lansingensis]
MRKQVQMLWVFFLFLVCSSLLANNPPPEKPLHDKPLQAEKMKTNPMQQFLDWYHEASQKMGEREAAYFILATASNEGKPSTRSMMAKDINEDGFSFIGNLHTQKFEELQKNPNAAVTFNWHPEQKQVNLSGTVRPLTREEAEKIFRERDATHQVTSVLFGEAKQIKSYDKLVQRYNELHKEYQNKPITMPKTWGGYHFIPEKIEFWQRGAHNLHSRIVYVKDSNGQWKKTEVFL